MLLNLIWRTVQPQCLNLSSFLRPQSPLWPKSGPNGAQENAWTRSDWAAWFIPTIVVQEWASRWTMDVARPSMVLQLWVWLRWTLVIILHKWVFVATLVLLPPSWVLQDWAWLGCWSQLCPGHRGSPSLRWDLQSGFFLLWWRFFLFPFLSVYFLDHTYILIGY